MEIMLSTYQTQSSNKDLRASYKEPSGNYNIMTKNQTEIKIQEPNRTKKEIKIMTKKQTEKKINIVDIKITLKELKEDWMKQSIESTIWRQGRNKYQIITANRKKN